jgi:hypothetical protein
MNFQHHRQRRARRGPPNDVGEVFAHALGMFTSSALLVLSVVGNAVGPEVPGQRAPEPSAFSDFSATRSPTAHAGPVVRRWYGWQLLLSDITFMTLAVATVQSGPGLVASTLGLTLGAPALHFANGNRVGGLTSLGVRVGTFGLAIALAVATSNGASCHDDRCKQTLDDLRPSIVLLSAGLIFIAIDDIALARVAAGDAESPGTSARRLGRRTWGPTFAPTRGGAAMALVGTF